MFATVNCARVRVADTKACGANVHEVAKLLIPPSGSLLDVIKEKPEFTILNKVIKVQLLFLRSLIISSKRFFSLVLKKYI